MDLKRFAVLLATGMLLGGAVVAVAPMAAADDPCVIVDTSDPQNPRTYIDPDCVNNNGSPDP